MIFIHYLYLEERREEKKTNTDLIKFNTSFSTVGLFIEVKSSCCYRIRTCFNYLLIDLGVCLCARMCKSKPFGLHALAEQILPIFISIYLARWWTDLCHLINSINRVPINQWINVKSIWEKEREKKIANDDDFPPQPPDSTGLLEYLKFRLPIWWMIRIKLHNLN